MSACLFRCWVGEGGTWVGFVVFLVLSVGWGWDLFGKIPCDLRRPFLLYILEHLQLHNALQH